MSVHNLVICVLFRDYYPELTKFTLKAALKFQANCLKIVKLTKVTILTCPLYSRWVHLDAIQHENLSRNMIVDQKSTLGGRTGGRDLYRRRNRPPLNNIEGGCRRLVGNPRNSPTIDKSAWEPKPTRMLLMQMTDGTSMVQGMEYRSIPQLTLNIKPGIKVLVSGTITVRRGMLMLTRDHISIMGGEVESLLITNSIENVLNRHLNIEETDEPAQTYDEHENTQVVPPSQGSQYYPSQINRNSQRTPLQPTNMPPPTQRPLQTTIRNKATATNQNIPQSRVSESSTELEFPTDDDLDMMQDDDFDDFLDPDLEATISRIETQASQEVSLNSTSQNQHTTGTSYVADDLFDDDFDDLILSTPEEPKSNLNPKQDSSVSQSKFQANRNVVSPFNQSKNKSNKSQAKQSSLKGFFSQSQNSSQNIVPSSSVKSNSSVISTSPRMGSSSPGPPMLNSSSRTPLNSSLSATFDSGKGSSLIDLTLEDNRGNVSGISRHNTEVLENEPPFTYLCFLPSISTIKKECVVKGFVMTLTSKLQQTSAGWELTVKINDGTASREIDIQNQVLQNLIGLTVDEMNVKKAEARTNPQLKQHLSKCVSGCQRELISLSGLLHLTLHPGKSRPMLTNITAVTQQHARHLAARARKLMG
ncbi:unnamed protein product, partial [Meganyctiphanes norvegica]